jgi:hypothetical protein
MTNARRTFSAVLLGAGLAVLVGGCTSTGPRPSGIPFAPYGEGYASKPDLAHVEHAFPLSARQLASLTPRNLAALTQEEVDQLYARLTAGPIPDGPYRGTFFFAEGGGAKRLPEILGGFKGFVVNLKLGKVRRLGQALWKGKVFYRDERELRNMLEHEGVLRRLFGAAPGSLRRETIGGRRVALLFPAKLYCGQSRLDSRRESVVIDYAFTDEIDGYVPEIDFLAGRNGLKVRDEIRMVYPGFYLGRAYMGKTFVLNFTLYNDEVARAGLPEFLASGKTEEDCFIGTQERKVLVAGAER